GDRLELLAPRLGLHPAEALDLVRVLVVRRLFAERLRIRDDGLLRVLELVRIEATDLGERATALFARRRRLALVEEHLDELLVLAERLADLFERAERDVVLRIELHDRRVDRLGARLVLRVIEDASGAIEERLLR